jgi:phage protein D
MRSDSIELTLDDRDGSLATPTPGSKFKIWLGYKEEAALTYRGQFVYDETVFDLIPRTLIIRARATNFRKQFKAPKTRDFHEVTLGDIIKTIAVDNNYLPAVHADFTNLPVAHLDQLNESDLNLIHRLRVEYSATFKIAGQYLVFMPTGGKKSVNTQASLPSITLQPGDVSPGSSVTRNDRAKWGAVVVKYYDLKQAKMLSVKAGNAEPVLILPKPRATQAEAEEVARARYKKFQRESASFNFNLPGNSALAAESVIVTKGWRNGVDGEWSCLSVDHVLDEKGYRCNGQAELIV